MYSCEEKKRAVELFIKYDKSAAAAINELGHPKARGSLYAWYRDCISGDESFGDGRRSRYAEEQKAAAVNHYLEHGGCNAGTRRALGYPKSRTLLAEWIGRLAPGSRKPAEGPKRFTCDQRREAVIDLVARKIPAQNAADAHGVTRCVPCKWRDRLLGKEGGMGTELGYGDPEELVMRIEEPEEQVRRLRLRKDILEGTIELLGKDQGADPKRLTNREKTELVEALKPAYGLKDLLAAPSMPKGSCRYQAEAIGRPDKYADLRVRVCETFDESKGRYGCRRIHLELRNEGFRVSEKVVARVMREEGLVAKRGAGQRDAGGCRLNASRGRAPDLTQRSRMPLPMAWMDQHMQAKRNRQIHVEERLLPGQLGLRGLLWKAEGGGLLRSQPEGPNNRRVHG